MGELLPSRASSPSSPIESHQSYYRMQVSSFYPWTSRSRSRLCLLTPKNPSCSPQLSLRLGSSRDAIYCTSFASTSALSRTCTSQATPRDTAPSTTVSHQQLLPVRAASDMRVTTRNRVMTTHHHCTTGHSAASSSIIFSLISLRPVYKPEIPAKRDTTRFD
ncbi:hypothetical protein K505DRAFT_46776 [Melanomma pulvis-pyrius CBS 109.77]|uniref:Uncharacterized protein n=1 Tax=Melanomma pulvis-pyrius CBS 109.77 TaxID=1314802 RepID=A0A6A6X9B9_9PLEO|nr:hypothetical protein K505DRAFT_46776 [Melanomma pulvis-pyrius CBS 109.77]